MWTWTPESRRWYADAAAVSGYHAALAVAMAPWLSPSWDVADMGCGLGFLSLAVAPLVRSVTALDTDRDVLESLAARAAEAGAGNVRPKLCDVLSGNVHGRVDAGICSFFGRPGWDAADFLSHAGRVLAVVRRHSSPSIAPGADHRGGEDDASVREALSASGIAYFHRDMDIEFGQPFADRDEAMAFLAHYDRGRRTPEERSARLDRELVSRPDGSLYLPHTKKISLIVYTSADSVFQVAANEELVPVHELYRYCEIAREMLKGEYGVGRVIARPFLGHTADTFYRTTNRHDLSLKPPRATMLDLLKDAGRDVIAVGKIFDIFDGEGVTEKIKTTGNTNGIAFTKALQTRDFEGLAFVNLVDFDMLYGHRRDVAGYAAAATEFDKFVADFIPGMREGDLLMVTADHGCDPSYTKTTDHTREYVPYLICGKGVKPGVDLGTRLCFGTIAQTICEYLDVDASSLDGKSVWNEIKA